MLVNVGIAVLQYCIHIIIRKAFQKRSSLVVNIPTVLFVFHRIHWVSLFFYLSGLELELQRGERQPLEAYTVLLEILRGACADEVAHKEDAAQRQRAAGKELQGSGVSGIMDSLQFSAVYWASRVGAAIAKHV